MNGLQRLSDLFIESLRVFGEKFMDTIPSILIAIIVILITWLLARMISGAFQKVLEIVHFDRLAEKIKLTQFLKQSGTQLTPSAIISRIIYWTIVILVIAAAAEALSWTAVSYQIQRLWDYTPNLVMAGVIFSIGVYLSSIVRDFIRSSTSSLGISTGRILSSVIYYVLVVMVVLTALEQAKIDTKILATNLLIIIGAIMLAASISYGLASKDVLSNILAGFFNKRTFQKGMVIEIDGIRGTIVEMTNIAVTLQVNESEKIVIPSHQLLTNRVKIIDME
jgi:small-conductance mechanosensitive channel